MKDSHVKARYAYLAEKWGCTCKQVDNASKHVFNNVETVSQEEFESKMYTTILNAKTKTKPKVVRVHTPKR